MFDDLKQNDNIELIVYFLARFRVHQIEGGVFDADLPQRRHVLLRDIRYRTIIAEQQFAE
jgi:hypothetical protein